MSFTENSPTVIFLDDDRDLALAVKDMLATAGYRVIARWLDFAEFSGGVYFAGAPDLIITDLWLGKDIGGEDVARRLRVAGATCPIVACSGDPVRLKAARKTGLFAGVLAKPWELDELESCVKHAIKRGSFLHNPTDKADGE